MSLSALSQSLTLDNEDEIPKDLILEIPTKLVVNTELYWGFSTEGLATITKIYVGYQLWVDNSDIQEDIEATYLSQIGKLELRLEKKDLQISLLEEDRDFIYKTHKETLKKFEKADKSNKIKIVLFTGGGVLVGVGAGILIGFLAGR